MSHTAYLGAATAAGAADGFGSGRRSCGPPSAVAAYPDGHGPPERGSPQMDRSLRASDADRETVARRLSIALRDGRLDVAEFDERTAAAYAARTLAELDALSADLPRDLW